MQRKRLTETAKYLERRRGIRLLQFIETTSNYNLHTYRHWLSYYGDQELDILIEYGILTPIRDIVIEINYNIPEYKLEN